MNIRIYYKLDNGFRNCYTMYLQKYKHNAKPIEHYVGVSEMHVAQDMELVRKTILTLYPSATVIVEGKYP